eukprot:scaffold20561_cov21-Prasinocladus_malaysianus.AAC.1
MRAVSLRPIGARPQLSGGQVSPCVSAPQPGRSDCSHWGWHQRCSCPQGGGCWPSNGEQQHHRPRLSCRMYRTM